MVGLDGPVRGGDVVERFNPTLDKTEMVSAFTAANDCDLGQARQSMHS